MNTIQSSLAAAIPRPDSLPRRLNLGCGEDVRDPDVWVNADAYRVREGVRVLDLTDLPWRLPSNHFEHVLWRHGPEHVPFIYRPFRGCRHRWILYDILEELWRIIRPGGALELLTPTVWSAQVWGDLQHSRAFTAHCFEQIGPDRPEAAYTTAAFEVQQWEYTKWGPTPLGPRIGRSRLTLNEHLHARLGACLQTHPEELRIVLRKPAVLRSTATQTPGRDLDLR